MGSSTWWNCYGHRNWTWELSRQEAQDLCGTLGYRCSSFWTNKCGMWMWGLNLFLNTLSHLGICQSHAYQQGTEMPSSVETPMARYSPSRLRHRPLFSAGPSDLSALSCESQVSNVKKLRQWRTHLVMAVVVTAATSCVPWQQFQE